MSCLWALLQLSRAELPAPVHHLPPTSYQGECWNQHTRLLSRHCLSTAKEDSHRLEVTLKGTLDSQCSGEATGATSPHRDNTLGARKDLMSLSSLFPHQFFLVNILCSQNTVSNIEPKSFSAMGLLFPVSHHCSSDHSMSCGCSALHSFLPRIVLNSRSFW